MSNNFNELQAAEVFLKVLAASSFVEAAKALGENPSSVSRSVAQLEAHLGERLLTRTTRSLRITEAGQIYQHYAQSMLDSRAQARESLQTLRGGSPKGTLRVSMPVIVGEQMMAKYLPEFHRLYPDLDLQIDLSNRNISIVEEGIDIAIRVGPMADSSLRAQRVAGIHRKVYASPEYLEKNGTPLSPEDLVDHRCIAFSQRQNIMDWQFWPTHQEGKEHQPWSLSVKSWLTCSSPLMVLQAIQMGLGLGRSAEWMCRDLVAQGKLVEILKAWVCDAPGSGGMPVYLVYPPGPAGQIPLKTRVMTAFLKQYISKEFD
jgi:DNA-binding transcriptional LysR family regulator